MTRTPVLLVLAALGLAAPEVDAQQYRRTQVPGKPMCLVWNTRDYVFRVDAAGSSRTPGDTEFAAIDAAFDTWRTLSNTCSDFAFTRGPDITRPQVGYVRESQDNENVLTFREVVCHAVVPSDDPCRASDSCSNAYSCWDHGAATIALTTTTFSFRTGYILDADIEFNAAMQGDLGFILTTVNSPPCEGWPAPDCVATDIQNALTHEIGHVVGLDHVDVEDATMAPSAPLGETRKRILDVGSSAGFCDSYPRGLPPVQCGESPETGRQFQAVSLGTGLGCGAAPEALLPVALLGAGLLRRRRAGAR